MASSKIHCCETMAGYIDPQCKEHPNPKDCEDALLTYRPEYDSYALLARFGSTWVTTINFCPWCGDKKRDLRERYFEELEALGFDTRCDEMPSEFNSDEWWRKRGI